MSTLKYNSQYKLGWSVINKDDFERTNTTSENLGLVISELANSSPEFDMMLLLYKNNGKVNGIINFSEKLEVGELVKLLNGTIQDNQILFISNETEIDLAEKETLKKIKEWKDGKMD